MAPMLVELWGSTQIRQGAMMRAVLNVQLIATATLTASERRTLKKHYASVDCRVQWLVVIEAVKARKYARFVAAFCRSPKVSLFLMERLFEELVQRLRKAIAAGRAF
jgi:hypothetical protein